MEGYAVDAVSSTAEAMDELDENAYPIVISDIYIDEPHGPRCAGRARGARTRAAP